MFVPSADSAFARYRASGDPRDLARVFDRTAPELLRFARHLVSSEAAAEDLVQETFLGVIEHRHEHDGERAALPWLFGMLVNHARAARRRARRELDHERLAREVSMDPAALAEEEELHGELLRALERLPEPYRPVLRLTLLHGLEPQEIAQALERPPGTVRAQLARGLEALRRALPAGVTAGFAGGVAGVALAGRGLAAVRRAVLEHGGAGTSLLESAPFLGGLALVASKTLLTVGSVAAAIALGLFLTRGEGRTSAGESVVPDEPSQLVAAVSLPPQPSEESASTREALVEEGPAAAPEPEAVESPPSCALRVLRAVDRTPLAGARVRLLATAFPTGLSGLGPSAVTDDGGRVELARARTGPEVVYVDRAGPLPPVRGERVDEVEVLVPLGLVVTGRVVDPGGRGVAGARIFAHGTLAEPLEIAECDASGRFELVDVQPGVALEAEASGLGSSLAHPLRGAPGAEVELELALPGTERLLRGRVRTVRGEAAAQALVAVVDPSAGAPTDARPHVRARTARCDEDGAFELRVGVGALRVAAFPLEREEDAPAARDIEPGYAPLAFELSLAPGAEIRGRVEPGPDAAGRAFVSAFPEQSELGVGALMNLLGLHTAEFPVSEEFRLRGLPAGSYQLVLKVGGRTALGRVTVATGAVGRWDVDLTGGQPLRVRVELPAGAELPAIAHLRLERLAPDGNGEFVSFLLLPPNREIEFPGLAPGDYRVFLGASPSSTTQRGMLTLARLSPLQPRPEPWVLALDPDELPSARLVGRLLDSAGNARAQAAVLAVCGRDSLVSTCTTTSDAQGNFRLEDLPPGDWSVRLGDLGGPLAAVVAELAAGEERALGELVVE